MGKFKAGDKVRFLKYAFDEDDFEIGEILTVADRKEFVPNSFYSTKEDTSFINDHQVERVEASKIPYYSSNTIVEECTLQSAISNVPKKYNDNKPMMSLIRPEFTKALAEALTYGYTKYDEERGEIQNYLKGEGFYYSTIIDSLERHLNAFKAGINIDEESGQEHLALAAANLMFLHTYENSDKGKDDRVILSEKI